MGKILTGGILIFISLGMIFTGSLLIDKYVNSSMKANYKVNGMGFFELDSENGYKTFKLDLFNSFGKISVIKVESSLIGWNEIKGLNKEIGPNQNLIITIGWCCSHDLITDNTDFSLVWIHFYLSDSAIIKWSNNNFEIT